MSSSAACFDALTFSGTQFFYLTVAVLLESSALSLLVLIVIKMEQFDSGGSKLTVSRISYSVGTSTLQNPLCKMSAVPTVVCLQGHQPPQGEFRASLSIFFLPAVCPLSSHCAHIDICFRGTTRSLTQGRGEGRV